MTDLDDAALWAGAAPALVVPKRCRRHEWGAAGVRDAPDMAGRYVTVVVCIRCGKARDEAAARRGRTNRTRGGAIQRKRITALGGRNLAGNNPNLDGLGLAFRYESKSGAAYPKRLDRWLRDIPTEAGQTAVLIVTETPGRGRKARAIVVVDYDAWRDLHGEGPTE